jgi:hypothetical protein
MLSETIRHENIPVACALRHGCLRGVAGRWSLERATVPDGSRSRYEVSESKKLLSLCSHSREQMSTLKLRFALCSCGSEQCRHWNIHGTLIPKSTTGCPLLQNCEKL